MLGTEAKKTIAKIRGYAGPKQPEIVSNYQPKLRPEDYRHSVPVTLPTKTGQPMVVTAMVDSGNVWTNVMSAKLFGQLGYDEADLEPVPGRQTCATAKAGASLKILGRFKKPLRLQLGGLNTRFKDRPVVLEGLSMDLNLSGTFLKRYGIDQLHTSNSLRVQGRLVPLVNALVTNLKEPELMESNIFIDEEVVIPPNSQRLLRARVPAVQYGQHPAGDAMVRGNASWMRRTDLHPWMNVILNIEADGTAVVGAMNTTTNHISVSKGELYGTVRLTVDAKNEEQFPWRVCIVDKPEMDFAQAVKAREKEQLSPDKLLELPTKEKQEIPEWMTGPLTKENRDKRIEHLVKYFKLDQCKQLATPTDVTSAALVLLRHWDTFSWDGAYGVTTLIKHDIQLKEGCEAPIKMGYRPVNPMLEGDLRAQ